MSLDAVNILTACALCYLGMFALNLSMERNAKLVLNRVLSCRLAKLSYGLGWCSLLLALCAGITAWGWAVGIIVRLWWDPYMRQVLPEIVHEAERLAP